MDDDGRGGRPAILLVDEAATHAFGERLGAVLAPGDAVGLSGPLGAGKTSLARGVLSRLGLAGEAPSPSFAIVQPYGPPETALPVLHVDLYRIEEAAELDELGLEDARLDAALLIEWPERMGARGWADMLRLVLTVEPSGARGLTAAVPAAWEGRWSRI